MNIIIGRLKEHRWFFIITFVLLLLSYWPVYRNYMRVPSDRYYYGGEEYPLDMTGDLTYLQEGYHGNLGSTFNYSTHIKNDPTFLKLEYVFMGHLARILHIDTITLFLVSRFFISLALLTVIWITVRLMFAAHLDQIVAYILILFGPSVALSGYKWNFVQVTIYDVLVFARATLAMPHYLIGAASALASVVCLAKVLEQKSRVGLFYVSLICGFISSVTYAPTTVLIISGFPLYCLFVLVSQVIHHKKIHISVQTLVILAIYTIVVSAQVLYVRYVVAYSWSEIHTGTMELLNPFHLTPIEYLFAVGPTYVLSWLALPFVLRSGKPLYLLLFTWVVMHPIGEFIISDIIHINRVRYFIIPYYVPFGLFAALTLKECSQWLSVHTKVIQTHVVKILCVIFILGSGWISYTQTFSRMNLCFCNVQFFDYGYPKKNLMHAIEWFGQHTKPSEIVLSDYYPGTLIPAFSGNTVFVSWWYHLINPPELYRVENQVRNFYMGYMDAKEADEFLSNEHISYILFSEVEQQFRPDLKTLPYAHLQLVYDKENTKIYAYKKL